MYKRQVDVDKFEADSGDKLGTKDTDQFWICLLYTSAKLDRIALICREGLSGARVVRAFVREDHEREQIGRAHV